MSRKCVVLRDLSTGDGGYLKAGTLVEVIQGATTLVGAEKTTSIAIVRTPEDKQFAVDAIKLAVPSKCMWRYEGGMIVNVLTGRTKKAPSDLLATWDRQVVQKKNGIWIRSVTDANLRLQTGSLIA